MADQKLSWSCSHRLIFFSNIYFMDSKKWNDWNLKKNFIHDPISTAHRNMLHFFFQQLHVATGSSWLGLYLIWWMYLPTCIRRIEILTNVNKTRRAQLKRLLTTYWWHDWGLNRFSRASTQRVRVLESGGASTSPSSSPLADSSMSCAVYGGRLVTNTEKPRTHSPSCSVCSRWATLNTNNTQTNSFYITHRPSQIPYMECSFFLPIFFTSFSSFFIQYWTFGDWFTDIEIHFLSIRLGQIGKCDIKMKWLNTLGSNSGQTYGPELTENGLSLTLKVLLGFPPPPKKNKFSVTLLHLMC